MTFPPIPPCPSCGQPLQHVALGPDTAPWLCPAERCGHGFWCAELTPDARAAWRQAHRDFGFEPVALSIRQDVVVEAREARARGTSARPELLPLLDPSTLQQLASTGRLGADFQAALEQTIAAHHTGG